jgi:hypothetical protein
MNGLAKPTSPNKLILPDASDFLQTPHYHVIISGNVDAFCHSIQRMRVNGTLKGNQNNRHPAFEGSCMSNVDMERENVEETEGT